MNLSFERLDTDLLILGAGGAGLMAAIHAQRASSKLRITIAVKGMLGQSGCTRMVQGGYNAVLHPEDSLEKHFLDTLKGGGWINNQELAWTLVKEAPERIIELENRIGCLFDRNPNGTIHQKAFAGQSFDRTVHKGDLTGIEIMSNLRDYILESDIRVLQETRGLDFLMHDGRVCGALLLNIRSGKFIAVYAKASLVATGGGATMYRISSPSLEKSGDGMAMACRAGAEFIDMEMLQFHPTGLLVGNSIATGGLLEEGLRGAGAHLYNGMGERFMQRYDPVKMERATRDVISRSSFLEIRAGRATPHGGIYIDVSHLGADLVAKSFPGMVERCRDYGFDLLHDRVEVSPSAHYQMGGIRMDTDCRTNLEGLFAAGEDAGGVHGANRLGGNGVADSIVYGARAGDFIASSINGGTVSAIAESMILQLCEEWSRPLRTASTRRPYVLRKELENLMWEDAGIIRNQQGLMQARNRLRDLDHEADSLRVAGGLVSNPDWNEWLNLKNLITIGQMVVRSAEERTESRGAHFREDYPESDPQWMKNILLRKSGSDWSTRFEDVHFTRQEPQ